MFDILTKANSARIALSDNLGRVLPEEWIIGRSAASVAWSVLSYAKTHGIGCNEVGYSVLYDDSKGG